ncbi:MAG: hypothetical protein WDW36_007262 [Sanguina aurantia]
MITIAMLARKLASEAYEILQGPLVRWSTFKDRKVPPTAVLVHGILGKRQNMQSFAKLLLAEFPSWQILMVDLRCHGESVILRERQKGPDDLSTAASDVLGLLRQLQLFPNILIGHSFGGKVVMSMVQQFGAQSLPRPVQVWVLDSLPGEVRSGDSKGGDHPKRLIAHLRDEAMPMQNRLQVVNYLEDQGFSTHIAQWVATNLRPASPDSVSQGGPPLAWSFDVDGIASMYESYEDMPLWSLLKKPPQGLKVDFVKAAGSDFRWGGPDEGLIKSMGHGVHLLKDSGHWVHTDNPQGLLKLLAPAFNGDLAPSAR